ncbi:catechol 2,3-dioxygenase-like lactoylglutathione lyase family enzyme [Hasllibacter halocynthiae]|uniref:Catechol 2,3-dioxygenase-like lactoylglutathione lyase family enzyme n=1 Tax=Hasllibacter halocynthiae TaxID=595589 RepID=A0A2T0X964_9RHOB|nr:VOC family protein [Hasllibacter halocynthiae]PRY95491.1 catechol 2,3-dioxygenase-like lactoylglutathione lyase family enzyme [Hasllibacter halocynthiae]
MKVAAVAIMVPSWEEGLTFYTRGLGFEVVEDVAQGSKRWVAVRAPGGGPRLVLAVGTDRPMARVARFLETDDWDRDAGRIEGAGGRFEEAPRDEPYGRVAVWRDPFGNRWDLVAPR